MKTVLALIAITLGIGAAVNMLGVKDAEPRREQTAGQWASVFDDERDYYYKEDCYAF